MTFSRHVVLLCLLTTANVQAQQVCCGPPSGVMPDVSNKAGNNPAVNTTSVPVLAVQRPRETTSSAFTWIPEAAERDWQFIVLHHTATTSGSVESIHQEHGRRKDRYGNNWLGIGYHFVIGNGSGMADGEISSTFRWKGQIHGAHSGSTTHNDIGIGVCLIGNFEDKPPSEIQVAAVTRLLVDLSRRYDIHESRIIPHSSVRPTACPGSKFPLQDVLQRVKSAG